MVLESCKLSFESKGLDDFFKTFLVNYVLSRILLIPRHPILGLMYSSRSLWVMMFVNTPPKESALQNSTAEYGYVRDLRHVARRLVRASKTARAQERG